MLRVKEMASCSAVVGHGLIYIEGKTNELQLNELCVCFKGFRRVQMLGEEHPHTSSRRCESEGVSDAEAAVVFNQRTGGTLQLFAE